MTRVANDGMGDTTVRQPVTYQGVTLWPGDGCPVHCDDDMRAEDLADWITAPIQRIVTAARLRAIADMLDAAEEPTA